MPAQPLPDERLLTTKLFIPPPPDAIARARLLARLNSSPPCALTLISAPPGYGKTTLVVDWLHRTDRSFAWLSLDPADNDPVRFFTYLIAALKRMDANIGTATESLLNLPPFPLVETLVATLINELAASHREFTLVLDDYHAVREPVLHQAIEFLIDHLPPGVHIVLITREDPPFALARLRVRGQLREIRADDLRFSREEATQLLTGMMQLDLDEQAVSVLEARTEGWVAGLQLAGLSLRGQDGEHGANFIAAFGGSDRFIIDYLLDEVLGRQTPEVRTFLCQTAILDRFNAALCDAVTGRDDSKAILAHLEKANVFLIPLDPRREWYRYHQLFADALRAELDARDRNDLRRQAAQWFAAQGSLGEAIEYALAGEGVTNAAQWMEQVAGEMLQRAELTTLSRWFDQLPDPLLHSSATLTALKGWVLLLTGQLAGVAKLVDAAEDPTDGGDARRRGPLLGLRAELARVAADNRTCERLAHEALAALGDTEPFFRLLTLRALGDAQHQAGDSEAATRTWRQAMEQGEKLDSPFAALLPLAALIPNLNRQGHRKEALSYGQRALGKYVDARGQILPVAGLLHVPLGMLHYEANELDLAYDYVQRGLAAYRDLGMERIALGDGEWTLARIQWARGESGAALATLHNARRAAERASFPRMSLLLASLEADLSLRAGDLQQAAHWAEGAHLALEVLPNPSYEIIYFVWARVLLAQQRVEEAQVLLGTLKGFAEQGGRRGRLITVYILQALAHEAIGNESVAVDRLQSALAIAAPEEYRRTFLDEGPIVAKLLLLIRDSAPSFVDNLLSAFAKEGLALSPKQIPTSDLDIGSRSQVTPPVSGTSDGLPTEGLSTVGSSPTQNKGESELVEPLSDREREVLRLLAKGSSNAEIARALVVSVGTAKWHVHHVIEKFGATNRTQAVARARELHLL